MNKFDAVIKSIAEQEMPNSEHGHIDQFQESTYYWANKNLNLMRSWIIETDMMLNKRLEDTDVKHFYIRLHGIVDDMFKHFDERLSLLKKIFKAKDSTQVLVEINNLSGDLRMRNYLRLSIRALEELEILRSEFSDFERKQIMLFRHQHSHPLLTKLSVSIDKKTKKFTKINLDQTIRQVSETDELEAMESFHAKLIAKRMSLKNLDSIFRDMQFV